MSSKPVRFVKASDEVSADATAETGAIDHAAIAAEVSEIDYCTATEREEIDQIAFDDDPFGHGFQL